MEAVANKSRDRGIGCPGFSLVSGVSVITCCHQLASTLTLILDVAKLKFYLLATLYFSGRNLFIASLQKIALTAIGGMEALCACTSRKRSV